MTEDKKVIAITSDNADWIVLDCPEGASRLLTEEEFNEILRKMLSSKKLKKVNFKKPALQVIYAKDCSDCAESAASCALDFLSMSTAKSVALFSPLEPAEILACFIIGMKAGVDGSKIRTGEVSSNEFTKISDCMAEINALPIYVDDTPSLTISALQDKAKNFSAQSNLGIVIINNVRYLQGSNKEVLKGLKALAKELGVPIIAFSGVDKDD